MQRHIIQVSFEEIISKNQHKMHFIQIYFGFLTLTRSCNK